MVERNTDFRQARQEVMSQLGIAMREVSTDQLKAAVEFQHGARVRFAEWVPAKETFESQTVWEGAVAVFDLDGAPNATRAYAWSSPVEGSHPTPRRDSKPAGRG